MDANFAGTSNLIDKFENSFMDCIQSLTKEDKSGIDKDEVKVEVENTIANFIDLARQMECFFLQKRFQLSVLKPELLLKEENIDLRHEIARKDELLKKHTTKIAKWKEFLLSDPAPPTTAGIHPNQPPPGASGPVVPPQMQPQMPPNVNPNMHQQQQMHPMQGGLPFGPRAGMGIGGGMGPTNPLAFLEKTTNNIMDMNPTGFNR
jgi:mediator of RNA polymerase II transcription subunit 28